MPAALPLIAGAFLAAGSVATAVGLGTAFVVAGLAITWTAVLTITGVALMAVAYLARKTPKPESAGQQLQQKLDPQAPVPIAFGRTATGGYITWRGTWGKKNAFYGIVTVLSAGGPIQGIESYRAGDYPIGFNFSPSSMLATCINVGGYSGKSKLYKGKLRQRWVPGNAPANTTPASLTGYPIPAGSMSGLAHAITSFEYETDAFPQGLPASLWTLNGVKLYDPRKDSTYPGGSGAQRVDQPATWTFNENPYLAALQWTLGRYENGKRVYGIGARWSEVDVASFVNGANVADANGWKVGGVVSTSDDKYSVLASLLTCGSGVPVARGAQIACSVNAPKTAVLSLTKEDIIGEVEISSTTSWRDRQNTIIPRYREESQNWEIISGERLSAATYVAEDGGETKTVEIEFPLVQQAKQAHQLAAYELVNSREFLTFTVNAKMRLIAARVGDAIMVNVPQIAASSTKCTVAGREFNPSDLSVTLTLKSETDAKHAYALGQTQVAPPSPKLDGYDPSNPEAPASTAWAITATAIKNDTVTLPAIVVTGAADDPNAATVIFEYRPLGSSEWLNGGEYPRTTNRVELTSVTTGTAYEVAVSYRTNLNVIGERLILGATAGDMKVDWQTIVDGPGKPEDGATVGAPADTDVAGVPASDLVDAIKDSTGTIKPVREQIADGNAILDVKITAAQKAGTDASAQAAQVRIDLVPTITAARAAATQVSTDLSSEVARAKNAEGTLLTKIESAQGGADGAYSLIATETLQRTEKDAALTQRIDTVTATANTDRSNTAAAISNEATTRSTDIAAVGRRVDSVTADYKTADGATNTRIATEEIASATRDEALGRRANTLESRSTGGGNLLANTDFLTLAGWTKDYGTAIEEINAAGSNWQLGGVENNLSLHDVNPSPTVYSQITSQQFAVEPGSYIQFSALVAAHRARGWVTVFFYDANGAVVAYGGENYGARINGGGSNILEHDLVGIKSFQVPSTAVRANMALRMYPNMPSVDPYAWFHRPYVGIARAGQAEWNPYATGSAKPVLAATNAAVREEAITRASQTEALVSRSATLEAQFRGELGSFINTRIANEEVARSTAVESIANRSAALESQFRGDTDSAVFARLRVEETTRATADNALVNRATALEARATGGGNLLTSTDFQTTVGWAFTSGNLPAATLSAGLNIAGSNYHLENENTLSIYQGGNAGLGFGGYCEWYGAGTEFAVQAGKFMQFYVYYNSHRANTMLYISWMNADGVIFLNSTTVPYGPTDKVGSNLNNYVQIGHPSIRVPDSAVKARMVLRKFDTDPGHADSYAWFVRPYAGIVREGTTEWNPYSPGSGKVAINAANARISAEETARANADGALGSRIDSVNATYSYLPQANVDRYNEAVNLNARVSNEAIASANRDGALGSRIDSVTATANGASSSASVALAAAQDAATKLGQARVTLAADAGNGRAQLSLYSDSYGNTGVDIVGNTTFKGSLDVGANSGGNRMKITSQLIEVFDANGVPRIRLGFW